MNAIETLFTDQGLLGGFVLILIAVIIALWARLVSAQDARLEDIKEHAKELSTVAREASRAMDGLRQVLEVRRDV